MKRVTIKDIAAATGLSSTTVSLVLNNKYGRYSQETERIVMDAAKALNYRPNRSAKNLISKRSNTVGLIIPDVENSFFSSVAKQVQLELEKNEFNMILCNSNDSTEGDLKQLDVLLDYGVDGILMVFSAGLNNMHAEKCFNLVSDFDVPFVMLDRYSSIIPAPSISVDHELGGYIATKHLLSLGHKTIGCINGPLSLTTSKLRLWGYIRAIEEFGGTFDPRLVKETDFYKLTDFNIVDELIERNATAIFASNDLIAYGVLQYAQQKGITIPGDLSLIGFDNLAFSHLTNVPLTTIAQPIFELGKISVEILVKMINAESGGHVEKLLSPELVERQSCRNIL